MSNKVLLDQSLDIPAKWNRIKMELKFGSHRNKVLQQDWNSQGEDEFEFSVVSELKVKEDHDVNLNQELQVLYDMVIDDLSIEEAARY